MKNLRVRRQIRRGSGVRSFLRRAGRKRAQRAQSGARGGRNGPWFEGVDALCVPLRPAASFHFQLTAVADKQCGGLQIRVDVGALPTRRAILSKAAWTQSQQPTSARGVEELHGWVAAPAAVPNLLRTSLNCAIAHRAAHSR